jgi:TonB family protein
LGPAGQRNYCSLGAVGQIEGTVMLDVIITADGFPAKIAVRGGFPCGLTDQAIEAVEQWRFRPATGRDGKPIEVVQTAKSAFTCMETPRRRPAASELPSLFRGR